MRREYKMIFFLSVILTISLLYKGPKWAVFLPIPICILLPMIQIYWIMRLIKSNPAILSKTTVEFDENNLSFKNDIGSSTLPWKSFIKAIIHKEYFELYISELQAYVIPKKAFDGNQLEKFESIVRKMCE